MHERTHRSGGCALPVVFQYLHTKNILIVNITNDNMYPPLACENAITFIFFITHFRPLHSIFYIPEEASHTLNCSHSKQRQCYNYSLVSKLKVIQSKLWFKYMCTKHVPLPFSAHTVKTRNKSIWHLSYGPFFPSDNVVSAAMWVRLWNIATTCSLQALLRL